MKKHKTLGNALSMLTASALLLSLCVIPSAAADSAAAPAAVFENTSGDGGSNRRPMRTRRITWTIPSFPTRPRAGP